MEGTCSTAGKGISLWQKGSRSARKGSVWKGTGEVDPDPHPEERLDGGVADEQRPGQRGQHQVEQQEEGEDFRDVGVHDLQHHKERHQSLTEWQQKRKERQCFSPSPSRVRGGTRL